MAIPKKGTRRIVIDNVVYRWLLKFSKSAEFMKSITIAVQPEPSPASKLIIYPIAVDVNYVDYNRGEPFTPKVVEHLVRSAFDAGWQPLDSKETFYLGDVSGRRLQ